MNCKGKLQSAGGRPCKRKAKQGSQYCGYHSHLPVKIPKLDCKEHTLIVDILKDLVKGNEVTIKRCMCGELFKVHFRSEVVICGKCGTRRSRSASPSSNNTPKITTLPLNAFNLGHGASHRLINSDRRF